MLDFKLEWIDATEHIKARTQPVIFFERPRLSEQESLSANPGSGRTGSYWVPVSDLLCNEIRWSLTSNGEHVRVPVFGYDTSSRSKGSILVTGLEMGMRVYQNLKERLGSRFEPSEVRLFLHNAVDTIGQGYRCYLGIAFRCDR